MLNKIARRLRSPLGSLKGTIVNLALDLRTRGCTLTPASQSWAEFRDEHHIGLIQPRQQVSLQQDVSRIGTQAQSVFRDWLTDHFLRPVHAAATKNLSFVGPLPTAVDGCGVVLADPLLIHTPAPPITPQIRRSLALPAASERLVVDLNHPWSSNYFHWFLDLLPRLREAIEAEALLGEPLTILSPGHLTEWQSTSLKRLAGNRRIIRHSLRHGLFRLDGTTTVLPSAARFNGEPGAPFDLQDPLAIRWLKQSLFPQQHPRHPGRRIMICREASRRWIFKPGTQSLLEANGFELVYLNNTSLHEQCQIFAGGEIVVAAHGAALTNLLFANDCRVFEIFPTTYGIRPDYFQLSMHCGHHYDCCTAQSSYPTHDIIVDHDLTEQIFRLAGL